jgi:hypothetical protein
VADGKKSEIAPPVKIPTKTKRKNRPVLFFLRATRVIKNADFTSFKFFFRTLAYKSPPAF